jgi:predicted ester cyclase
MARGTAIRLASGQTTRGGTTARLRYIVANGEAERNKDVVRRYVRAFNDGDIDLLASFFETEASIHGVLKTGTPEEMKTVWSELHAGLAVELHIEDVVVEGSTVAVRYTETGTSRAPFFGSEPTGKSFSVSAMEWFSIRDGKIYEWRGARNSAALQRQIR